MNTRPRASLGRVLDDLGATLLDLVHGDAESAHDIKFTVTNTASHLTAYPADLKIQVKRKDSAKLKAAVKSAKLSKSLKKKLTYRTTKTTVTLVIKGVRTKDEHARKHWVSKIRNGLDRRKVKPIYALV